MPLSPVDPTWSSVTQPTAPAGATGWVVGDAPVEGGAGLAPAEVRARRLEARLAVYAQYAAVVAEQAAAAVEGDLARAAVLATEREQVAEHFAELQAAPTHAAGGTAAESFPGALAEALAELEHQGAVDVALRQRLLALREAVARGAAWASGGAAGREVSPPALLALPAATSLVPSPSAAPSGGLDTPFEGAQLAARAAQVGGLLGGQFPGRGGRDEGPAGAAVLIEGACFEGPRSEGARPDGARLDVRF